MDFDDRNEVPDGLDFSVGPGLHAELTSRHLEAGVANIELVCSFLLREMAHLLQMSKSDGALATSFVSPVQQNNLFK